MIKRPGQMLVPDDNKIVQNLKHKSVRNLKDKNKNKNMIVGIDFNACILTLQSRYVTFISSH